MFSPISPIFPLFPLSPSPLCLVGVGVGIIFWLQPRWLLSLVAAIAPGVVYFATTEDPLVALTIDDGPDSRSTPKILATLSHYQSQATFFLISSQVPGNEDILATMVRQGHEIGNHLTHDEPSIKLSSAAFAAALVTADEVLCQFAEVRWLRPGGGWYSAPMIEMAQNYGYQVALGSVFPYDTHIPSSWFASRHILANVRGGSIIVLHDGGQRGERTASTLATVLPELRRRGYRVVTLSELLEKVKGS